MRKLILACAIAALASLAGAQTLVIGAPNPNIVYKSGQITNPPVVAQTVYTTPAGANQVYRACVSVIVTTAGTGGSVFPTIIYTQGSHTFSSVSFTQSGTGLAGVNLAVAAQWNNGAGCYTFAADGGTAVQLWLGLGGVTGSPAYLYSATIERLN